MNNVQISIDMNVQGLRNAYFLAPKKCFDRAFANVINRAGTAARQETKRQFDSKSYLKGNKKLGDIFRGKPKKANGSRGFLTWKQDIRNNSEHTPLDFTTAREVIRGLAWTEYRGGRFNYIRAGFINNVRPGSSTKVAAHRVKTSDVNNTGRGPRYNYKPVRSSPGTYVPRLNVRRIHASSHSSIYLNAKFEKPVFDFAEKFFDDRFEKELQEQMRRGTCIPKFRGVRRGVVRLSRDVFRRAA